MKFVLRLCLGIFVVIVVIPLIVVLFWEPPTEEERQAERAAVAAREAHDEEQNRAGESRLREQLSLMEDSPCGSQLVFRKMPIGGWYVTCDGCAGMPADSFFPPIVLDTVEQYAINRELPVTQLLKYTGECR